MTSRAHILLGSGSGAENAVALRQYADGVIVNARLMKYGVMENPADVHRVKALIDRVHAVRERAAVSADLRLEEQ